MGTVGTLSPEPRQPLVRSSFENKADWLTAWEDRLKLREAYLEDRGQSFPRCRATPMLEIHCLECSHQLSCQGMQVFYKENSDVDLYCTNQHPDGTEEAPYDFEHNLCGCRMRDVHCRCGLAVGYHMYERCTDCSRENCEDEDHEWFFESERVGARPRIDAETQEVMFWSGQEMVNESSIADSLTGDHYFDENSIVLGESARDSWGCSPLMDRNGRQASRGRKSLSNIHGGNQVDVAALRALEEKLAMKEEECIQTNLDQAGREKYLRDATVAQEEAEQDLAVREQALIKCKEALDAREIQMMGQLQNAQGTDEATKRALQQAEQKAALKEAEADALRVQLMEQQQLARSLEDKLSGKNLEIQQVQNALAEVKREVRRSGDGLIGRGRLPPMEEATASHPELIRRIRELEQELSLEKMERISTRAELQQAKEEVERKDADLERLLPKVVASRTSGAHRSLGGGVEADRLRRELEEARAEMSQLRSDSHRRPAPAPEDDPFAQARLAMATKLSQKRLELDRREQALAERESCNGLGEATLLGHHIPGVHPQLHGGSGVPHLSGGGLQGWLERIGVCNRRQQQHAVHLYPGSRIAG